MKVAVVGGGVSGLAAAYSLGKNGAEVVVYEKEDALGGHAIANTVTIDGSVLDLGFMAFSQVSHPDILEFLDCVGVEMEASDMSFSVSLDEGQTCKWSGFPSLFAHKTNLLNMGFWKMIREVAKFNKDALIYIDELESNPEINCDQTLEDFVQSQGYSELFRKAFLVPICASIWSCCPQLMSFSAYSVLSVLHRSHALELFGGNITRWCLQSYVHKIKQDLESRGCWIRTSSEVHSVSTNDECCVVTCKNGVEDMYDRCIIATNAPDAVKILGKEATYDELRILGAFPYTYSNIFVHHDDNLMPKNKSVWSSRNFLQTRCGKSYITYWLNNIQNIRDSELSYFLTLNAPHTPKSRVFEWSTSHPIPSVAASKALSKLNLIQGRRGLWFCGSYQGCGLPDASTKAGILVANNLLGMSCSIQYNIRPMSPSWPETVARLVVTRFLRQFIVSGCLSLQEEGGTNFTFEGTKGKSTLKSTLRIHNPQFYWKVATESDLGFANAYINGDFSFVDKNEGLRNCLQIFIVNTELLHHTSNLDKGRGWWGPMLYTSLVSSAKYFLKHMARRNTLSGSRKNISDHYDYSNKFFSLFLGETMSYSCPIFQNGKEDLKTAVLRRDHTLIEKARIGKDHHVLEIGCGWGNLALEVVKLTGCKYTGITLSKNQYQYVEQKVKEAGLQDHIELILCDYRELPKGIKYDRIISCEMIEHVGREYMDQFFQCCESALAPNGVFVLQFIAMADGKYDEYMNSSGFINEYIFPGGCLPSFSSVTSAMATGSRLSLVHLEEIGCHYFYALRWWRKNFLQNRSEVLGLGFDEKCIRTWEYYFDYTAAGFKLCVLGDYQIVLTRPADVAAYGNDPYNPVP